MVDPEDVRLAVYESFAHTGAAPSAASLAGTLHTSEQDVRDALRVLAQGRHLALDDADRVVMAHPFSAVPLGFSVMGASTLWWGGCSWDSFAMAHLLTWEPDLLVATQCPACRTAQAWTVNREAPPDGRQIAHFLVPAAHMWDDVVHTCGNQRIFCSQECLARWLAATGHQQGYVMDLATLWRLASGWYAGRLDRGYVRREPADAAEYLRGAGLSGPFWGL